MDMRRKGEYSQTKFCKEDFTQYQQCPWTSWQCSNVVTTFQYVSYNQTYLEEAGIALFVAYYLPVQFVI